MQCYRQIAIAMMSIDNASPTEEAEIVALYLVDKPGGALIEMLAND